MAKSCEHQQANARLRVHIPATSWHPHRDFVLEARAPTEFEMWAQVMRKMLMELSRGNLRLMVGYWGDALNVLPPDVRTALLTVLAKGLGLEIRPAQDDPNTIEITLVERYPPLAGPKKTPGGLVVPKSGALVLPGQPGYNLKEQ